MKDLNYQNSTLKYDCVGMTLKEGPCLFNLNIEQSQMKKHLIEKWLPSYQLDVNMKLPKLIPHNYI